MTRHVHVASPLTPFKHLVRLMEENRVSAIPIVDHQGVPIGMVSGADLLLKQKGAELESSRNLFHVRQRRRETVKSAGTVAAEVMTSPVVTVEADISLSRAASLMQEWNVRRLVVVDERGRIAGIVSQSDVLQVFLRTDEDLREEIAGNLIAALSLSSNDSLGVEVRDSIATLSGEVDRKSDAEILTRLTRGLDGVVSVIDQLTYRWDDSATVPVAPASQQRDFRAI